MEQLLKIGYFRVLVDFYLNLKEYQCVYSNLSKEEETGCVFREFKARRYNKYPLQYKYRLLSLHSVTNVNFRDPCDI